MIGDMSNSSKRQYKMEEDEEEMGEIDEMKETSPLLPTSHHLIGELNQLN
jgi:hypothetical protein